MQLRQPLHQPPGDGLSGRLVNGNRDTVSSLSASYLLGHIVAISSLVFAWLSNLRSRGILRGGTILEVGPSDLILYTPAVMEFYIRRHVPAADLGPLMARLFDAQGLFRREEIGTLYGVLGFGEYRAVDLKDPLANWHVDLNYPVDIPDRFEAVSNYGTAEHVFNIFEVFRSIHTLLKVGGVQLHVSPVYGDVNHGFYNIHPTAFFDMAKANGYVVEDASYVDQVNTRSFDHLKRFKDDVNFNALPITRAELEASLTLGPVIDKHHVGLQKRNRDIVHRDYLFLAMRKTIDAPFRIPTQALYA